MTGVSGITVPVLAGNHHLVVILQGGHQTDAEHLEEIIGDGDIPIHIKIAELLAILFIMDSCRVRREQGESGDNLQILHQSVVDAAIDTETFPAPANSSPRYSSRTDKSQRP